MWGKILTVTKLTEVKNELIMAERNKLKLRWECARGDVCKLVMEDHSMERRWIDEEHSHEHRICLCHLFTTTNTLQKASPH